MSAESTSSATRRTPARVRRSSSNRSTSSPSCLGVAEEVVVPQRVLVLEQKVVHLPERALLRRGLGRLRRLLRVRVDVVERQVPPDVGDVAEVAQQLAHDRLRLAAVRALEVAVLEHGDRRVDRAADVVALRVDRLREVDDEVRRAEQRPDPRPPGQPLRSEDEEPGERRREQRRAEDSDLRLGEVGAVEREIARSGSRP